MQARGPDMVEQRMGKDEEEKLKKQEKDSWPRLPVAITASWTNRGTQGIAGHRSRRWPQLAVPMVMAMIDHPILLNPTSSPQPIFTTTPASLCRFNFYLRVAF